MVRKAYFARPRMLAATNERHVTCGVVWRSKRSFDEHGAIPHQSGNAVNGDDLERLLLRHQRENPR